jgi:hypothetical protein
MGSNLKVHRIQCFSLNLKSSGHPSGNRVRVMVFNTAFNNISVISWWLVLLVEEPRVLGENH